MNPEREYLVPAKGLKIPNPETPGKYLPEAGASVTVAGGRNDSYWRRRKRDEDVTVGKAPEVAPEPPPADPVSALLAGNVNQVKAGLGELSTEALEKALVAEQAEGGGQRSGVITAIQAEIASHSSNK